ncbi:hypothetical protein [Streptomyces sp. NPDC048385]|uniref:hypothetical protein n=1 Tax=unclassified Streptomyces TaxID=2593676 RepID=UPI00341B8EA4
MAEGLVDGRASRAALVDGSGRPEPTFERMSAVADAVLYEGYLLYPYRRSSPKNRARWQFGVLFPRDWVEADGPVRPGVSGSADSWYQQTECLVRVGRPDAAVRLRVRVRYLQVQHKQVEDRGGRPVESLTCADGTVHLTFEEAVAREADIAVALEEGEHRFAVGSPAGADAQELPLGAGRIVRRREEVRASTVLVAERLAADLFRLRVRTANEEPAGDRRASRDRALRHALVATHTLLGVEGAEFVSLIDPGPALREAARNCRNDFTFPVLGGAPPAAAPEDGSVSALLLSSPIILPDHPQVAPESPGDLHDAGEIDEILTLRTMLLTEEEKREARATDPRAAEILDRVDTMPPEVFERLHGAIRSLTPLGEAAAARASATRAAAAQAAGTEAPAAQAPATEAFVSETPPAQASAAQASATQASAAQASAAQAFVSEPPAAEAFGSEGSADGGSPGARAVGDGSRAERPAWWQEGGDDGFSPATDTVLLGGVRVGGGSPVRLRPRGRGADAQDMFLAGRTATVAAVFHDVDGSTHLAVTVDDDPAAELHGWYGRFHYFRPDEVEPLGGTDVPDPAAAAQPSPGPTPSEA